VAVTEQKPSNPGWQEYRERRIARNLWMEQEARDAHRRARRQALLARLAPEVDALVELRVAEAVRKERQRLWNRFVDISGVVLAVVCGGSLIAILVQIVLRGG
jgi:hypothetical protein